MCTPEGTRATGGNPHEPASPRRAARRRRTRDREPRGAVARDREPRAGVARDREPRDRELRNVQEGDRHYEGPPTAHARADRSRRARSVSSHALPSHRVIAARS